VVEGGGGDVAGGEERGGGCREVPPPGSPIRKLPLYPNLCHVSCVFYMDNLLEAIITVFETYFRFRFPNESSIKIALGIVGYIRIELCKILIDARSVGIAPQNLLNTIVLHSSATRVLDMSYCTLAEYYYCLDGILHLRAA
jgi:hypothetical protein